ncbi:MAG: 4-hydroxythreonine-4-phosphate dehydrogenase PdxA [Gammaproteobacteria bacterium]
MSAFELPRIALTPGEPAGIGPDLCLMVATREWPAAITAVCDPALLAERARLLDSPVAIRTRAASEPLRAHRPGRLVCLPVVRGAPTRCGQLDGANARYVLETLDLAADGCLAGEFDALVTGPAQKSVINDAGISFSGHTEYLAARAQVPTPVMLLVAGRLRVALATTHLPLREVAQNITTSRLTAVLVVLHADLQRRFGLPRPRILVCGVNPHAGEGGHLGREEIEVVTPALEALRGRGMDLAGPLPADTAFTPAQLERADAVLAMYHDQGLPVLKHAGFGRAVNVTLGLPFIRTSVDHGTALRLAGTGQADSGSLEAALTLAIELARRAQARPDSAGRGSGARRGTGR